MLSKAFTLRQDIQMKRVFVIVLLYILTHSIVVCPVLAQLVLGRGVYYSSTDTTQYPTTTQCINKKNRKKPIRIQPVNIQRGIEPK